ncbi:MAG: hypothetical protein AAB663_00295 [Patescibacteria group bacterium]
MKNEHPLAPLWKGILCMALGVLIIYWVFHSGGKTSDVTPQSSDGDETEICAQIITPATNPDTGEVVDFPTPCDVPEGWEVN